MHDGLGRDFGLFLGLRTDGTAVIEDFTTNATPALGTGATPAGGFPPAARLELDASDNAATGHYDLVIEAFDTGNVRTSRATASVSSDRVLGAFGLVSHRGSGDARFWFDDFTGTGAALHPETDRHLAILGAMYTLSRGTLKLTAQLPPVHLASTPPVVLEIRAGATWQPIAAVPIDNTDNLSGATRSAHRAGDRRLFHRHGLWSRWIRRD